jgi:hypothetical protein
MYILTANIFTVTNNRWVTFLLLLLHVCRILPKCVLLLAWLHMMPGSLYHLHNKFAIENDEQLTPNSLFWYVLLLIEVFRDMCKLHVSWL